MAAEVAHPHRGSSTVGHAGGARPQAQVQVLEEEEVRAGRTARGAGASPCARPSRRRSPSRPCAGARRGRARRASRSARGRSGGCTSAGISAPTVPGSGWAERWTDPSGFERAAGRAGARGRGDARDERGERRRRQLAVGVQQHGDVVPRPLDPGVVRGAEAGVRAELEDSAPAARASAGAVVRGRRVHDDSCGRGAGRASEASSAGSGPRGVVGDDDDREGRGRPRHRDPPRCAVRRPPPQRRTRPSRGLRPAQRRDRARPRRRASRARSAGSPATRQQRVGEAGRVARPHVERAVAEHLAQDRQVADDRPGVPAAIASTGGSPKPSSHDGSTSASAPA